MSFFSQSSAISNLLNKNFRWMLMISVMILNFIAFYHDPIRFSDTKFMDILPSKWFAYITGMYTFAMDAITFIGLWLTIPLTDLLPPYWYISFVVIGFAIITQITIDTKLVRDNGELNPPPQYLFPIKYRIIIYALILIIDTIMFIQFYIASGIKDGYNYKIIDVVFLGRFGSFKSNKIAFTLAWLGLLGVFADIIALRLQYNYEACNYNHPISWNF